MNANELRASELRIGNWYNEFGIAKQVTPDTILRLYQIELAGKIAIDVSHILVTHDKLIQIGFKHMYGRYTFDHDFELELQPCPEFLVALRDSDCEPLIYVHEIQNLFFALYRKELPCQL